MGAYRKAVNPRRTAGQRIHARASRGVSSVCALADDILCSGLFFVTNNRIIVVSISVDRIRCQTAFDILGVLATLEPKRKMSDAAT